MKRIIAMIMACSVLMLFGCSGETAANTDYTTTIDGQAAVISFLEGSLSEGKIKTDNGTYTFAYSMDGTLSIVYPNGYIYSQKDVGGGIAVPADYDASAVEKLGYIDGFSLARAISSASDSGRNDTDGAPIILSLFLLAVGIWFISAPRSAWWISKGWYFKNAEPSDLSLIVYRVGGCMLVFGGIISFFA